MTLPVQLKMLVKKKKLVLRLANRHLTLKESKPPLLTADTVLELPSKLRARFRLNLSPASSVMIVPFLPPLPLDYSRLPTKTGTATTLRPRRPARTARRTHLNPSKTARRRILSLTTSSTAEITRSIAARNGTASSGNASARACPTLTRTALLLSPQLEQPVSPLIDQELAIELPL